jgi:hypothetical protein
MSRKVLILANVGNRDVLYGGEELRPAREKGEELLARFDEAASQIELPILSSGLRYVESLSYRYSEILGRNQDAPRVGIFCTDQEDPRHRQNDTLMYARIAEKKLPRMFPNSKGNDGLRLNNKNPVIVDRISDNPARYDRMYRHYERFFDEHPRIQDPENWLCFVLASGGTPAMNAMLILHAVQHFGENCVQVYVPPGEEPTEMRVGKQIADADARRRFNEALDSRQFQAAARIAARSFGGYRVSACTYADHRLAFDFRRAVEECERAVQMAEGDVRDFLERHVEVIHRLERGASVPAQQKELIAEVFYNLEVKHRNGEYVDVLGRAFRLAEALLTWAVETNTSIRSGKNAKLSNQENAVNEVPGLRECLAGYTSDEIGTFDFNHTLDRPTLLAIAECLTEPQVELSEDRKAPTERAVQVAKRIKGLADLRNKTILAHGFEGVSEERMKEEYGSDTLVEDLRVSVGEALGRNLSTNPFLELAERLRF